MNTTTANTNGRRKRQSRALAGLTAVLTLLCFGFDGNVRAQGFDWQYSARMPSAYPDIFFGITGSFGLHSYSGLLRHNEDVIDPISGETVCRECGRFESGDADALSFGVRTEHWLNHEWSVNLGLQFQRQVITADERLPSLPHQNFGLIESELRYKAVNSYFIIDIMARRRLFDSFLSVGAGIETLALVSNSSEESQQIISPAEAAFELPGGLSSERAVEADFTSMSAIALNAKISLGYDMPLARGLYLAPAAVLNLPLIDIADDASWSSTALGFQVSFLYGAP